MQPRKLGGHSAQDDDDLRDSASVASVGQRNHADSKRESAQVKDGLERTVVEDKQWRGGVLPGGYTVVYGEPAHVEDADGRRVFKVPRTVVEHPV